ncbi:MAG: hypothetical protein GY777_20560 [Candidatus Brocadiaceae bacterium]|nr:hypothetical protein [Candidatus Brocadiaceae bacterium]
MKAITKQILFVSINVLLLLLIAKSLMIFTSLMSEKLPWYEPCGMQFIIIYFFVLLFFVIGGFEVAIGEFIPISKTIKLLPFITGIIMALIITIGDSLKLWMQISGTSIGLLSAIVAIVFTVKDLIKINMKKAT